MGVPISIPAEAPYDTWTFIDFPNTRCANGTPTGLAVSPHQGSTKALVFFMGGGLCWDVATCTGTPPQASNLNGYSKTKMLNFANGVGTFGIFDRTQAQNPFAGYTFVILPYCTGDFHTGDKATTYGTTTLEHRGYPNVTEFMSRLVPTFAGYSQVVVTGMSAGGWGAAINFGRMHAAFTAAGVADVPLIDDSGAFLKPTYHTVAMQQAWKAVWGQLPNLPAGCTSCDIDSGPNGGLHNVYTHYAATIPGFRGSLIHAIDDNVVSVALGRPPGNPNLPCDPTATTPPPCQFHPGLYDLHNNVLTPAAPGKMRSFFMDGYHHTWLFDPIWNVHPLANSTTIATFLNQQITSSAAWVSVVP